MTKLSVTLAVFNEEENLEKCLSSIKNIATEIIIVDGGSTDNTVEIAKRFDSIIIKTTNPSIFHINKQKALEVAKYDWVLQLDADERVGDKLATEIVKIISMTDGEIEKYQNDLPKRELFLRHQRLLVQRDGKIGGDENEYSAFFIPRLNYFLGRYLRHGGVYPDGVIRLFKRDKAHFPCKSVHEQIQISGKVGWLKNDLLHLADPNIKRYLIRNDRYINLITQELIRDKISKNFIECMNYFLIKPIYWFLWTQIRHKGILDGPSGIIFSFFSALRFPRAYYRYLKVN